MNPILIPIVSVGGAFILIGLLRYFSFLERKAMIEKGVDPSLFANPRQKGDLRFPFLLIGVAIGLLLGNILEKTTTLNDELCYFSMSFLFGGLGLVASYFFHRREEEKRNQGQ